MSTVVSSPVAARRPLRERLAGIEQGILVIVITVVLAAGSAVFVTGFATLNNAQTLLIQASTFGILALAQAVVILGGGLDLSVAGVALGCSQGAVALIASGVPEATALIAMALLAVVVGVANGLLIAYVEVPALIVTLATGMLTIGGVNIFIMQSNHYDIPAGTLVREFARGSVLGIPRPIAIAAVTFVLIWLVLRYTSFGRLIRAMGDNFATARSSGAPVRPLQVLSYVISALLALLAGLTWVSMQGSVQSATTSFDPLLFTALTVAVIGGISLSGGQGSILGVIAGTVFVAILNNLLILLSLSSPAQDLTRGLVLLGAIFLDAWLHPRDEETAKSGEL